MLRTCNIVRIAGLQVLRNDGLGRASPAFAPRRDGGRGYVRARRGKGGFETRPYENSIISPERAYYSPVS
ncbi:MAG: hypothetical protein LBM98_07950 [Oscillospiraceae bacterium]|nr:hypothetical protein [Oscillospiraceae bacterium]